MKDKFFRIISLVLTMAILLTSIPVAAVEDDDNIDRIEGENRYETSALISKEFFDKSDTVIIASGEVFPDALVGGVLAAYEKSPLLTVGKDHIPSPISAEIQRLGASKAYVLGGESTISPSVISGLSSMGG